MSCYQYALKMIAIFEFSEPQGCKLSCFPYAHIKKEDMVVFV